MELERTECIELVQIHQCLRNEFTNLAQLISRSRLDPSLRESAFQHFLALKLLYDSHSQVEDDVIFPNLYEVGSPDCFRELERQHCGQKEIFIQLEAMLENSSNPQSDQHIVELADRLRASICLHLNLEEEEILPLLKTSPHSALLMGKVIGERPQEVMKLMFEMLERNLSKESFQSVMKGIHFSAAKTHFSAWISNCMPSPFISQTALMNTSSSPKGCNHYQHSLLLYADCCNKYYSCAKCHNEKEDHEMVFSAQHRRVWCMHCFHVQDQAGAACIKCFVPFASYHCPSCNIWESNRALYHCPYCNKCRVGKGLGKDFHHCMKCNQCIAIKLRTHKCVEAARCSICIESLDEGNAFLSQRCGHVMHKRCAEQLLKFDYRCPSCRCSLINMDHTWQKLDDMMIGGNHIHTATTETWTRCHDCGELAVPMLGPIKELVQSGKVLLKVGEKCSHCGSFNTL